MFSAAVALARQYTYPIVFFTRNSSNKCQSGIGSFVVINEEGWIITAWHIIKHMIELRDASEKHQADEVKRQAIRQDSSINANEKARQLKKIPNPPNAITNYSHIIGWPGVDLNTVHFLPDADLAVAKLDGFKPEYVLSYPSFKDPSKPMNSGSSLCKLGFPFHTINVTFNQATSMFDLPAEAFPIPHFPIEGIFTRRVMLKTNHQTPYPQMFVETSSPGLKGQSGGPTFDTHGAIWAIQSQTASLPLEFGTKENQYFNVGWGTHSETIIGFLREKYINFQLSAH
jgi:hypothetical protein